MSKGQALQQRANIFHAKLFSTPPELMVKARAMAYRVGDRVDVRPTDKDQWRRGIVTSVGPVMVKLDGSDTNAGPWKFIKRRARIVPIGKTNGIDERCSRCTMLAVWNACDVFWEFDTGHTGAISRADYFSGLASQPLAPTVARLRMIRRADLSLRFRNSARDVTLEEFLKLLWPLAAGDDWEMMRRWSELREARYVLNPAHFRGTPQELERVFELLDRCSGGKGGFCSAFEFVRAEIYTREEIEKLVQRRDLHDCWLDYETYRGQIVDDLKIKFRTEEITEKMKEEEYLSSLHDRSTRQVSLLFA